MIKTRIVELLGCEHPIVMGGMTGVGDFKLAAAVSETGAFGIFAAHNSGSPEECRKWIKNIRNLTSRPFGVNLTLLPHIGEAPPYQEYAQVIVDEGVKVVETAGSNPKEFVSFFKDNGLLVIHKCVTIRHALAAEKLGVDIISLDGFECAGHPGEGDVGNFVLQPAGAQLLSVPFIASGGITKGSQIAAALALGASGVNLGTAFCSTKECSWPEAFKSRILSSTIDDTVLVLRSLKNTCRVVRNDASEEVKRIELTKGDQVQFSDLAHVMSGARGRKAEEENNPDAGIWSIGQGVGLIDEIRSCNELVRVLMNETMQSIDHLVSLRVSPKI